MILFLKNKRNNRVYLRSCYSTEIFSILSSEALKFTFKVILIEVLFSSTYFIFIIVHSFRIIIKQLNLLLS